MPNAKRSSISYWRYVKRRFIIPSEILMLDLLKSLFKKTRGQGSSHLGETLTPKIFKGNTLKNTENQRPTSKKFPTWR